MTEWGVDLGVRMRRFGGGAEFALDLGAKTLYSDEGNLNKIVSIFRRLYRNSVAADLKTALAATKFGGQKIIRI